MNIKFWNAVATITGGTIGAGLLAIPYVISKSGFWTGVFGLIFIGIAFLVINLCLGEVVLRTKGDHQLTGYSKIYLGKIGKFLMAISMVVGIYGAMIAYTIGAGESLSNVFGLESWIWMIIFYALMIFVIYFDLKVLGESEFIFGIIKLVVFFILLIFIFSSKNFSLTNLKGFDITKLFIPYGVLVFSYMGTSAIVESKEVLGKGLKYFKRAIIISSVIIIISYLLFAFGILGLSGASKYEIATNGIGQSLGYIGLLLANVFALLTMTTPFIVLGYALKEMYIHDYKINKYLSWLIAVIPPIFLLYFGTQSFIKIVEISGAITAAIAGVIIILMYKIAKRRYQREPEYIINIPDVLLFLLALLMIVGSIITII